MMVLFNIIDELNKLTEKMQEFMKKNMGSSFSNPIFWIGILVVGILLFHFTYNALQKEK